VSLPGPRRPVHQGASAGGVARRARGGPRLAGACGLGVAAAGGVEALGGGELSASGEPKVFISYRREETAGHAGRLYDVMASRFGDSNVFMDVDIAPGVDFVNRITQAVDACHVLLVIIGPRWASITNGAATPRLAQPGDFVRLEVEEGLRR